MDTIQLVNGSWTQTFTTILYEINKKLNDTEIDDIIRRIDENFQDDIISLKIDNSFIKYNLLSILSRLDDFDTLKLDNNSIKSEIKLVLDRLNSLSIVKEVKTVIKEPKKERVHFYRPGVKKQTIVKPNEVHNKIFIMDMFLRQGHSEPYRIDIAPGVYTNDSRLSWLVSGDKRRLTYNGELTQDILDIYNKYGITDIEVIKKSRVSTYDPGRIK